MYSNMRNHVTLYGSVERDPVLRRSAMSRGFTFLKVRVMRTYKSKETGKYGSDTFDIAFFDKAAERACAALKKGDMVLVEATLEIQTTGKDEKGYPIRVLNLKGVDLSFPKRFSSNEYRNWETKGVDEEAETREDYCTTPPFGEPIKDEQGEVIF